MFNERFVVERLIRRVCALRYPHDRLLIQVLDDSTDESQGIAQAAVIAQQDKGLPIEYVHRVDRTGFKAGALEAGMRTRPEYELIAIFDADFMPSADFLENLVPHFTDQQIGMVQARCVFWYLGVGHF